MTKILTVLAVMVLLAACEPDAPVDVDVNVPDAVENAADEVQEGVNEVGDALDNAGDGETEGNNDAGQ